MPQDCYKISGWEGTVKSCERSYRGGEKRGSSGCELVEGVFAGDGFWVLRGRDVELGKGARMSGYRAIPPQICNYGVSKMYAR